MLGVLAPLSLLLAAGEATPLADENCLDLAGEVTVEGLLEYRTIQLDVGEPDGTTSTKDFSMYVVALQADACFIDEGGERQDFSLVQAYTELGDIEELMKRAKGKMVRLTGDGFPGHTRYHIAPLVLEVYGFATVHAEDMDDPLAH